MTTEQSDAVLLRDIEEHMRKMWDARLLPAACWPADLAQRLTQAVSRAPVAPGAQGWHAPGLGEVHNSDHTKMIYCADGDGVADDGLAQEVRTALSAARQPPETAPVRKPLTDDQIEALLTTWPDDSIAFLDFARAIERAHGIGET